MSDETTGVVTDEELAAALEGTPENTVEEMGQENTEQQTEQEEKPETKEVVEEQAEKTAEEPKASEETVKDIENAERSSLGRKVARQAREIEELKQLILQQQAAKVKPQEPENDGDEIILTRAELREFLRKESSKKEQEETLARGKYVATLEGFAEENDHDTHEAIIAEVFANHNKIHTGNPETDAKINYRNAEREILRRELEKLKGKKEEKASPLKGGQPKVPLGVAGSSANTIPKKPAVKLSSLESEAAKAWGLSEEEVVAAVKR